MTATVAQSRVWSKVLYQKQPFPDDFVPESFLKDLKKNVNIRNYSLRESVIASIRFSEQVSLIILLVAMFSCLSTGSPLSPVNASIVIVFVSVVMYILFLTVCSPGEGWKLTHSILICLVGGLIVSPILKTLTETISTDTVYAMVTLMLVTHVLFFDYGIESSFVSSPISFNAALFAAVCLASRLSTIDAFLLLVFAADLFVLFFLTRKRLENTSGIGLRTGLSLTLILLSIASLSDWSPVVRVSYYVLLILLNILFPVCFFRLQVMKENIYGPWDEAIIRR